MDIKKNNLSNRDVFEDFFHNEMQNIAFLINTATTDYFKDEKFISEDRFFESMSAMMIRKEFCCKKLVETFVHRLLASGLYFKYHKYSVFLIRRPHLLKYKKNKNNKRKLTLTDVAPAFMFLLAGYFISFLFLIGEIVSNRQKTMNYFQINKRKQKERRKRDEDLPSNYCI